MIYCDEIQSYLDYASEHPEELNQDRIDLIENVIKPVLIREDVFFDEATYRKCLQFCEKWFYPLFPYQKFIYAFVFMFVDDVPLFRTFVILMGRGNGKDGSIMPLLTFLTTTLYGVKGYNIDIVATSEDQAEDTFNVLYEMLEDNKRKMKLSFYWNKVKILNRSTHSRIKYNTSNAKTKDGKKIGAILFNEYHAYENNEQTKVFRSALGKVKHARIFIITTNGYVRGGPLDEIIDTCREVLAGGENELKYFPYLCMLDSDEQADDPSKWILANPSINYLPELKQAIKDDYINMKRVPSEAAEFYTKRMNRPREKEETVAATWPLIMNALYSDVKNKIFRDIPKMNYPKAIIGIDFADYRDFASAGWLVRIGNQIIWRQKTFICEKSPFLANIKFQFDMKGRAGFNDFEIVKGDRLDENYVIEWALKVSEWANVRKIVMDNWQYKLIKQGFENYGISTETKTNPFGKVRLLTNYNSAIAIVVPKIEKYFIDGSINFGDSRIMAWYTNNTKTTNQKNRGRVYEKIEPKLRKNDGFMAFAVAMTAEEELKESVVYM